MANLIIKSSANDLVIQGSDESPAITVAAAGTTTFAEECTLANATITAGTFPSLMPVKVKSTTKVDTFTTADHTTDGIAITGLAVTTDTPQSGSSKFLIMVHIGCMGGSAGTGALHLIRTPAGGSSEQVGGATTDGNHNGQIVRGACNWNNDSNHTVTSPSFMYLDSPSSTVAITYQVNLEAQNAQTFHIGRSQNNEAQDAENAYAGYASSSITVMEVQ